MMFKTTALLIVFYLSVIFFLPLAIIIVSLSIVACIAGLIASMVDSKRPEWRNGAATMHQGLYVNEKGIMVRKGKTDVRLDNITSPGKST